MHVGSMSRPHCDKQVKVVEYHMWIARTAVGIVTGEHLKGSAILS